MTAWIETDLGVSDGVELYTDGTPELMTPDQARELAFDLLDAADRVEDPRSVRASRDLDARVDEYRIERFFDGA